MRGREKLLKAPDRVLLEAELDRIRAKKRAGRALGGTLTTLLAIAAADVLISFLILPVFWIYGDAMSPAVPEGSIVLAVKGCSVRRGDTVAFYVGNKLLVRRVIAVGPDTVDGVDVPVEQFYVRADRAGDYSDSGTEEIGCIRKADMAGKIIWILWPFPEFGPVR